MAVDHCSIEIAAGEICMIVGPSGCGKTTLLNAIAGFHDITSGRILLDGEVLCSAEQADGRAQVPTASSCSRTARCSRGKRCLENVIFGPMVQGKLARKRGDRQGAAR